MTQNSKIYLITGAPRSGTTVIGEALIKAGAGRELYEPMNVAVGQKTVRNEFEIPNAAGFSEKDFRNLVQSIREKKLSPRVAFSSRKRNSFFNRTRRTMLAHAWSLRERPIVWKDPFAFFCAPLAARESIPAIISYRDPLSLAGSFSRMDWFPDVADIANRLEHVGHEIQPEIRKLCDRAASSAQRGALLWNLFYTTLWNWLESGQDLKVIDVRMLKIEPVRASEMLSSWTGLNVRLPSADGTSNLDVERLPQKAHIKNRSASSITDYWRKILTENEISFVNEISRTLASCYDDYFSKPSELNY